MASHSQKIILVTLILTIAIPVSTSHRKKWGESSKDTEQYLRDLCTKTDRSEECWKILKPELYRFGDSDEGTVAGAVIDLAIAKSDEIHDKLKQDYSDSKNDELKEKYNSCSRNYNDVNRNLVAARRDLDSDVRRNIAVQIKDAGEELKKCKREFEKESFDPAHIRDRNKEIGLYLEIVRAAAHGLENHTTN